MLTHKPASVLSQDIDPFNEFDGLTADHSGQVKRPLFRKILELMVACLVGGLAFLGILASPLLATRSMTAEPKPNPPTWVLLTPTTWITSTDPISVSVQVTNDAGFQDITFYYWQGTFGVPVSTAVSLQSTILTATDLTSVEGLNVISFSIVTNDVGLISQTFTISVDTIAPTAIFTNPHANTYWNAGAPVNISWSLIETNSGALPTAVWFITSPAAQRIPVGTTSADNVDWIVPLTATSVTTRAQIELDVSDQAGNSAIVLSSMFNVNKKRTIYLPLVLKPPACTFALPDCYEPNNSYKTPYGPLSFNTTYSATADFTLDTDDWYTTTLNAGTRYTITLNYWLSPTDLDLFLYRVPTQTFVAKSNTPGFANEKIVYVPTITGKYYIRENVFSSAQPTTYTLRISK